MPPSANSAQRNSEHIWIASNPGLAYQTYDNIICLDTQGTEPCPLCHPNEITT